MAGFSRIGLVEGFYGRIWTVMERERLIAALAPFGLNTYLYCPKQEPALGAELMRPLSHEEAGRLSGIADYCHEHRVALWAGLHLEPPFNVSDGEHIEAAAQKCLALWNMGFTGFCVQFDDLASAFDPASDYGDSLAGMQGHGVAEIFGRAAALGVRGEWLAVPALYSQDALLQNTYGPFEPDYLALLDARLPPEVAWMYTGPQVCSSTVTPGDVRDWQGKSSRRVVLWDNYPVNDAAMVNSLHLSPLTGRAPDLPSAVMGYLFNPLLQAELGSVTGATCISYAGDPAGYDPAQAWEKALAELLPEAARQPFRELEALTRQCCLAEFLPDKTFGGDGPLAARLERSWEAMKGGGKGDAAALRALGDMLNALDEELPAPMHEGVRPWLLRLRQAYTVFASRAKSANWSSSASSYRQGKAWVLGEWFSP